MGSDRRHFLKAGLGGLAGLTSLPLVGSLAGCAAQPTGESSSRATVVKAKALPIAPVAGKIRVITGAPGNVAVLDTGTDLLLVDSGSLELAPSVQKTLGRGKVGKLFNTHYHGDQTGGNALFATAGAEIHAHTITKQWLAADYYATGPATDPTGPASGTIKVEKGGWWGSNEFVARSAYRHYEDPPTYGDKHIGFRVASQ